MKKLILTFLSVLYFMLIGHTQVNPNSTYVKGYYKSNGTYVNGYYRTTPNSTINDNYSTYPNINPYTGKQGTIQPEYNYNTTPVYNYYTPTYSYPTYNTQQYYYYPSSRSNYIP